MRRTTIGAAAALLAVSSLGLSASAVAAEDRPSRGEAGYTACWNPLVQDGHYVPGASAEIVDTAGIDPHDASTWPHMLLDQSTGTWIQTSAGNYPESYGADPSAYVVETYYCPPNVPAPSGSLSLNIATDEGVEVARFVADGRAGAEGAEQHHEVTLTAGTRYTATAEAKVQTPTIPVIAKSGWADPRYDPWYSPFTWSEGVAAGTLFGDDLEWQCRGRDIAGSDGEQMSVRCSTAFEIPAAAGAGMATDSWGDIGWLIARNAVDRSNGGGYLPIVAATEVRLGVPGQAADELIPITEPEAEETPAAVAAPADDPGADRIEHQTPSELAATGVEDSPTPWLIALLVMALGVSLVGYARQTV